MRTFVALITMHFCLTASAQTVLSADTTAIQPTIIRDEVGFKSCGVRVIASSLSQVTDSDVYDFSISAWQDASVFFKAGSSLVPFERARGWDVKKLKTRIPGPESFWIAERDNGAYLRPPKYVNSDDPGYMMGLLDSQAGIRMIWSLINGKPAQVSMRYKGERQERIISFQPKIAQSDAEALQACFNGLVKRMEQSISSGK